MSRIVVSIVLLFLPGITFAESDRDRGDNANLEKGMCASNDPAKRLYLGEAIAQS